MKTLIIYLSATGHTEWLAREIANKVGEAELFPIHLKTKIPKSEFWRQIKIGFFMWLGRGIEYQVGAIDATKFDQIVVGGPVWMGRVALPVMDVVNKLQVVDKVKGIFVTCGAEPGNAFSDFQERTSSGHIPNHLAISMSEREDVVETNRRISVFVDILDKRDSLSVTQNSDYEG